jgi:hypothetical protein
MKYGIRHLVVCVCAMSLLQLSVARAAADSPAIHVYVNDACIVADEPFFLPEVRSKDGTEVMTPKFLPLIGLVIGKLVEMFISSEMQSGANAVKSNAARKDTRYALTRQMSLYRADLKTAPKLSINSKLGCMTIVAASLKPPGASCTADYIPKTLARESLQLPPEQWKTSRADSSVENQLRRANICVDGKAAAVYESRFEFSEDGTAYRLKDAGYRINSLLTTSKSGATRSVLVTLKVSQPGPTDQQVLLSSAWVKLGMLSAGAQSAGSGGDLAPWLQVPPLSIEARRAYDEKTRAHQDVAGQIEALRRAMTREQRVLDGLNQRLRDVSGDVAAGLNQEHTRVEVEIQTQGAELDALTAEYRDLPQAPLEFMPVTIEVAVTETESEKKLQLALADLIGSSSTLVASSVGGATTDVFSKSVSNTDLKLGPDATEQQATLVAARARYFDALIASRAPSAGAAQAAQTQLSDAKRQYNDARQSLGLEALP